MPSICISITIRFAIDNEAKNDDNKTRATVHGKGASERISASCDNCWMDGMICRNCIFCDKIDEVNN